MKLFSMLTLLVSVAFLQGCGSSVPDDVVKAEISRGVIQHSLDSYKITNHYTDKLDNGDEAQVVEYTAHFTADPNAKYATDMNRSGTFEVVKRGNGWYHINATLHSSMGDVQN